MKTLQTFFTTMSIVVCLLVSATIWGSYIPTQGEWKRPGGLRSSIPTPPEASVDGNTVSIYFEDELSNLTIYIMEGPNTVYQTVISSNGSDYTCDLPWIGQPGDYQILMVHGSYGYLGGRFSIE